MWSVKTFPKPSSASFGFGLCVDALTTLIASDMVLLLLEDDRFPVETEDLPVHVGHFAQGNVVLDRVHEDGHHVVAVPARLRELLEPPLHLCNIARCLSRPHALDLLALHRLVELRYSTGFSFAITYLLTPTTTFRPRS